MTKQELVDQLWKHCSKTYNLSKSSVNDICDNLFGNVSKAIKKDKRFTYPGFGTWTVRNRKARKGRNPQTGEEIKIAASRTVTFKPAAKYKETL